MYSVIEFEEGSVATAYRSWFTSEDKVRWPRMGSKQIIRLLSERLPAPPSSKEYAVKVLRKTDDMRTAMRFESILQELSELPSSDATNEMKDQDKRVTKRVFRPEFTSDDMSTPKKKTFPVDIDYSPPPPSLTCMATTSISTSPQTNVAFSATALSHPAQ
ncbi:hypothetical protein PHET_12109 [Paragonimus heterotremus]|uniref:Uncharacterized protein n=1 Tax=Paragonimus heterotremus TaxID=100268 RepID=A0A8J4T060_9TREM|nr:hypothetical protein PHET_12109 [Paragonimus heterotremus]